MFNECHIHLCDCTWLDVFHMLNFCWSNTKRFLSVLVVFGKYFSFYKKCQNFQKQCCPILATWSRISPVAYPQLRDHTVGFCDSLAGHCPSREKYLGKFSKIWVFRFLATKTGDWFVGESSSCEGYTKIFAAPFATSSWVELSVAKNT